MGPLFSGCSGVFGSSGNGVHLTEVVVANAHRQRHIVNLSIFYNDDLILDDEYELPARDGDVAPSEIIDDQLPDDPGKYVLTGWVDDEGTKSTVNVGTVVESDRAWTEVITRDGSRTEMYVSRGERP
jgi:hypothetical protein